jgi:hypothetical protein
LERNSEDQARTLVGKISSPLIFIVVRILCFLLQVNMFVGQYIVAFAKGCHQSLTAEYIDQSWNAIWVMKIRLIALEEIGSNHFFCP